MYSAPLFSQAILHDSERFIKYHCMLSKNHVRGARLYAQRQMTTCPNSVSAVVRVPHCMIHLPPGVYEQLLLQLPFLAHAAGCTLTGTRS